MSDVTAWDMSLPEMLAAFACDNTHSSESPYGLIPVPKDAGGCPTVCSPGHPTKKEGPK